MQVKIFIPIVLEIFKAKYVQETNGPPHTLGILGWRCEDRSINLLDNPQEEVPIDALGKHRVTLWSLSQRKTPLPRKAACRLVTLASQGMLPQELGPAHPSVLPRPVALYLDKGVPPVCSLCHVQGPGDVLSTDGDRVFDQTVSESLVLHLGRDGDCVTPVQGSLAWDLRLFLL